MGRWAGPNWADASRPPLESVLGRIGPLLGRADCWTAVAGLDRRWYGLGHWNLDWPSGLAS
ncbi:hypothetical protein CDL15_Pgr015577 [Punica granatum]|uniref:Uncharacterized protein n=1 Tax=Punica granatum TaxID=22663 RepID=A0A218XQJ8_PUNGR|nr:hypothetical protein CDL15_Pgr015577 [Punica granatum]